MRYADVVDRIRTDFNETPAMELTLGQAARLSGVTPAAISLLLVHLKRRLATSATEASKNVA